MKNQVKCFVKPWVIRAPGPHRLPRMQNNSERSEMAQGNFWLRMKLRTFGGGGPRGVGCCLWFKAGGIGGGSVHGGGGGSFSPRGWGGVPGVHVDPLAGAAGGEPLGARVGSGGVSPAVAIPPPAPSFPRHSPARAGTPPGEVDLHPASFSYLNPKLLGAGMDSRSPSAALGQSTPTEEFVASSSARCR